MQVWQCNDSRPVPELKPATVDPPQPGPGEVVIQIHAAGVTSSELLWYPTTHQQDGAPRCLAIPGHEFSGVLTAAGPETGFAVGQAVFGMNDWFAEGAMAEFCCALPSAIAPKPVGLTHVEAASVPISALTGWQGLFERAHLRAGERVLIHGGSGAVGVFAIQLARGLGAQVVTTASLRHRDLLFQLGAERVIDYRTERFEELLTDIDVVFDAVGGPTLQRSWGVLKPGGRLVTIAASGEVATDERTRNAFFIVEPHSLQLHEIVCQLDSGRLRPVVEGVIAFDQANLAYKPLVRQSRGCGKTTISVVPPDSPDLSTR